MINVKLIIFLLSIKNIILKETQPLTKTELILKILDNSLKTEEKDISSDELNEILKYYSPSKSIEPPENFDWLKEDSNMIGPVRNQGSCGCCYAMCLLDCLAAQYYKTFGKKYVFSTQFLLDCGYAGCNGGEPAIETIFFKREGKIATEEKYPFISYNNVTHKDQCKINDENVVDIEIHPDYVYMLESTLSQEERENYIKTMLYEHGPIITKMYINNYIYDDKRVHTIKDLPLCNCGQKANHGVLIVGYGVNGSGIPYWTIKNSWGESSGTNGYFKIQRGINLCRIESEVYLPILKGGLGFWAWLGIILGIIAFIAILILLCCCYCK